MGGKNIIDLELVGIHEIHTCHKTFGMIDVAANPDALSIGKGEVIHGAIKSAVGVALPVQKGVDIGVVQFFGGDGAGDLPAAAAFFGHYEQFFTSDECVAQLAGNMIGVRVSDILFVDECSQFADLRRLQTK